MDIDTAKSYPTDEVPEIMLIGLSHKSAPVEVREKFSIDDNKLSDFLDKATGNGIKEIVYLSTCNRVCIYFTADDNNAVNNMIDLLADFSGLEKDKFTDYLYKKYSRDAVVHLFSVVSSLDSMVIGESEIISQVKEAYRLAVEKNKTGFLLNRLFHQAFKSSKKVRTETAICENPLSIAFIATEQAKELYGDLGEKNALLIGAGEMGELILKYMTKNNIADITIANRSLHNAEKVVDEVNKEAHIIPLDDINEAAGKSDIIISSTAAPGYIFSKDAIKEIMRFRDAKPLFIIDISVPRNIDPDVTNIENVHLYNIDDLKRIADDNLKNRMKEVELAMEIINADATGFFEWYESLEMVPMIVKMQQNFEKIRDDELKKYRRRKLKHLSDEDFSLVMELTKQIMTKTLHKPIIALKQYQERKTNGHLVDIESVIEELFD